MGRGDIIIRIAGESGEGVISTGDFLVQAAARAGFNVMTFKTFPAEIKGGHAVFQARFSRDKLWTHGDEIDVLLAFNEEAFEKHYDEIAHGGMMLFDSGEFTPTHQRDDVTHHAVPLSTIAKDELKFALGKNVVAVGVAAALFGLSQEVIESFIREKFERKGDDVVQKNLQALTAGQTYLREHLPNVDKYTIHPNPKEGQSLVLNGNAALALGALQAGLKNYFGYPITPASEVMEFLAPQLPKVGGVLVQAEDEIAAMGMCLGSSYMGTPVMTATSGPGLSLMVEMIGLAAMAELPVVIVDVQRGGPSTGLPTKHEQSDLFLAAFGGHGDAPRLVLAPTSVEDCFYTTIAAFNLAEKYQMPVIVLSDQTLATRTESVPRFDLGRVPVQGRLHYTPGQNGDTYLRYAPGENGVSPMSVPGQPGGRYVATGLEHGEAASPKYDPQTHIRMTEKRFRKQAAAVAEFPEPERYGDPNAEIGLIGWGSTFGFLCRAVERLRDENGLAVEALAPKGLFPVPTHQLAPFLKGKKRLLVAEVNYQAQFTQLLRAAFPVPFEPVLCYGGVPFKVSQIVDAVRQEVHAHV